MFDLIIRADKAVTPHGVHAIDIGVINAEHDAVFPFLALRGEIVRVTRDAVFVRTAISDWRLNEVAVRRHVRARPLHRRRLPRVVALSLASLEDAQGEIDDERDLRDGQNPDKGRHDVVEIDHLDGVLLLEHLDDDQRRRAVKELTARNLAAEAERAGKVAAGGLQLP